MELTPFAAESLWAASPSKGLSRSATRRLNAPHAAVSVEGSAMAFYDQFSDSTNFVVSFTPNPKGDFGVFAKGYTRAANHLAGLLLEAQRFSDYEAYPVVFLYRQALELSLKHIIYTSVKLVAFKYLDDVHRGLQTRGLSQLNPGTLARPDSSCSGAFNSTEENANEVRDQLVRAPARFAHRVRECPEANP
jgi:hypothetical protein